MSLAVYFSTYFWELSAIQIATVASSSIVGIILAFFACLGLSALMHMPFLFNPGINLLALVFSAAIGIIFGFVPARRAAGLDPIVALRFE